MKEFANFWRYVTLALLFGASILCLMATPTYDLSLGAFVLSIVVSKGLCVGFAYAASSLYKRWNERGYMDYLNGLFEDKEDEGIQH